MASKRAKSQRAKMKKTKTVLIGDILKDFFDRPYIAARIAEGNIETYWRQVVGPQVAAQTTELRIENRVLHVRIASSLLRHEIFLQRDILRDEINRCAKVRLVNVVIVR